MCLLCQTIITVIPVQLIVENVMLFTSTVEFVVKGAHGPAIGVFVSITQVKQWWAIASHHESSVFQKVTHNKTHFQSTAGSVIVYTSLNLKM